MVHTNTYHGISTRLEGKHIIEEANLVIGTKQLNEHQDKMMLNLLRIAANISFIFFELIVSKKAKYKETNVLYIEDYDLIMFGKSTEEIIYELMEELKKTI